MIMYLRNNKRGVSPLIATVLLIAFAVSLGAVVINLGVNLFGDPCKSRSVEILTIEGSPRVCHVLSTKTLSFTAVNTGSQKFDGLKLTVVGDIAYNDDLPYELEALEKKVVAYPIPDIKKVDLVTVIPYYSKQGQIKYCAQKEITYSSIPTC